MVAAGMPRISVWRNLARFVPLVLIAAVLIGAVLLIMRTVEHERNERQQVEATNLMLAELRNLGRAVINAETGQRGYFITLDRRYLEPYLIGKEQFEPTLRRLREVHGQTMTARQAELLDEIETAGRHKFSEMEDNVALISDGKIIDAQTQILSNDGQRSMAQLRTTMAEMERIELAILKDAAAETAAAEARVLPLLALLLAMLLAAIAFGYFQIRRTARAEAEAANTRQLSEARDRADLLARELNHRVKNLFAVILAIVQLSGRGNPQAQPVVTSISDRIKALLKAHEVTQGSDGAEHADLRSLIETTIAPYRGADCTAELSGPQVTLSARQATPLGLALHEMTTNAVKYGAWSNNGEIAIAWRVSSARDGEALALTWRELVDGGVAQPTGSGFGSRLMDTSARQLSGTVERSFTDEGVEIVISFPLDPGAV